MKLYGNKFPRKLCYVDLPKSYKCSPLDWLQDGYATKKISSFVGQKKYFFGGWGE